MQKKSYFFHFVCKICGQFEKLLGYIQAAPNQQNIRCKSIEIEKEIITLADWLSEWVFFVQNLLQFRFDTIKIRTFF